ncbi:hypothetical protein AAMO2058_001368800 [Amorphochlora amoebiformis]
MSLFRSEDMRFVEISVVREKARQLLGAIGRIGVIHIVGCTEESKNSASNTLQDLKSLKSRVMGCTERLRRLQDMEGVIKQYNLSLFQNDHKQTQSHHSRDEREGFLMEYDLRDSESDQHEGLVSRSRGRGERYSRIEMRAMGARRIGREGKDAVSDFESVIEPTRREILSNINLINHLKSQESLYRECKLVLTECTPEHLRQLEEDARVSSGLQTPLSARPESSLLLASDHRLSGPRRRGSSLRSRDSKLSVEFLASGLHDHEDELKDIDMKAVFHPTYTHQDLEGGVVNFFQVVCGSIAEGRAATVERSVFRVSRGNAICHFSQPTDEKFYNGESKQVFTILTSGSTLPKRLAKVLQFMGARLFFIPNDPTPYIRQCSKEINRLNSVIRTTQIRTRKALRSLTIQDMNQDAAYRGDASILRCWQRRLEREKLICQALSMCRVSNALVHLQGWVPASKVSTLRSCVDPFTDGDSRLLLSIQGEEDFKIDSKTGATAKRHGPPPTYFISSKWTDPFQQIVNTYGIPRYKEVNPGIFTIVTFPFTFGVMYGDMGHGLCVFIFALYLIYNERAFSKQAREGKMSEIFSYAFYARYALLPMGFFALYCGSIYNDFVSVPFEIFPSKWQYLDSAKSTPTNESQSIYATSLNNQTYIPYPYGVDPGWYHTKNELSFFNSLKMKMSVILGVSHMLLGIFLNACNHVYFEDYLSLYTEWVPRLVFMLSTFGYMCIMIIVKWSTDYGCQNGNALELVCPNGVPPSLIQTMIKMFLSPGNVPIMLFAKPIMLRSQNQNHAEGYSAVGNASDDDSDLGAQSRNRLVSEEEDEEGLEGDRDASREDDHEDHHSFGGIMIHQGIHTIEYVLGCVSNTASYLRLWALSLAHAQLAQVFWMKFIINIGLGYGNPVILVGAFAIWAFATFAVLLCMDLLECFLHALRLHWVEFQNKFYHGDGIKYTPFTLP